MLKRFTLYLSLALLLISGSQVAYAQCGATTYNEGTVAVGCGAFGASSNISSTAYRTFSVVSGISYSVSTCGSAWDTQLTLKDNSNVDKAYNDDNGPSCSGTAASVDWTADYTGTARAFVHRYNCGSTWPGTSAILTVRQNTTISNTTSTATICQNGTKALTSAYGGTYTGSPAVSWSIISGGGSISGTTYTGSTTGSVTVRATLGVCVADVTFNVEGTPVSPTLGSASPANGTTICAGYNSGTVTGTGGSGGVANEYQVSINGGATWSTYTSGAAITTTGGTGSVIVQARRTGSSCSNTAWTTICTWPIGNAPAAPTLSSANPASGTTICAGYNSGTVTANAGSGGSTGAADEYQVSINGGATWSAYTNGAAITTTGATGSVIVQGRRTGGSYGCSTTAWSTLSTWTVASAPVAPTLSSASPASGTTICAGYNSGTVTANAGSGGSAGAADEYQYSINGGATWTAYTNGAAITTTGATGSVIVQGRRTGGSYGCSTTAWSTLSTWTIGSAPVAPTLSAASPANGSTICAGYNSGTVTATGGSGGSAGATNEYQVSINGGATWAAYTSGAAITTTGATGSVIVQARRTGGSYGCTTTAWSTISTWTIGSAPVAPTLATATPASGTAICAGYNSGTVTANAGSGGSTGAADEYQVSINGGSTWSTYTIGTAITTTGATGSVIVQGRRTGGSYGCTTTAWSTLSTWPIASSPVAPTLATATPASGTTICAGYNSGTVTANAGSGGSAGAADEYQYSINGGSTWSTYTLGAAITTTGATGSVIVQGRRTGGTYGCSATAWSTLSTWTIGSAPVAPTLSVASPANGSTICAGYNSGTVTATGGSGGSTGAANEYQYSIDGGATWAAYTNGAAITTTGATGSVIVQARRTGGSYGCTTTAWSTISTWTIGSAPVAPTLSVASPASGSNICQGYNSGTVTGAAGSGGSTGAADEYQVSINGGTTWSTYTNGAAITTTGATGSVIVQARRTGGSYGCTTTAWSTISTWTVNAQPGLPTLNTKSPNVTDICQGQNVSATINAGSGGAPGAADTYEYSTNGGSTWATYTSGATINTASATGSVQVRVSRSAGTGTGCTAVGPNVIATWNVSPQAVAPTLNTKTPNVTDICQGQGVSATITAGSGGSAGAADVYEYSTNGGSTWAAYTSGNTINTSSATGSVQVRVSRTAGSGTGCNTAGPNVIATWNVSTQAVAPTLNTKTPNVTDICQGQGVSATITAGSGGSAGAADVYEYSTNGGSTWAAYTSGNTINTSSATGSVQVRVSRTGGTGTGCNTAGPNVIATWNVSPQAVAPTLGTKTPNVTDICQGQGVSATITAGSGGSAGAADVYEYSTNGGSTWTAYTSGNTINTSSATGSVQVRVSRTGGTGTGCNTAGPNVIATWNVSPQAVAPTLGTKTPNVTDICQGQGVSATITAGSGGSTGAADVYEYSTNAGATWASYTSGTSINTASATGSVQVRVSRTAGSGTGCTTAGPNVIATWNVSPQAVAPTLNTKTPNVSAICQGDNVSATVNAGSGGSAGAADTYEYSINGGSTWSAYTPGATINTTTATGSVQVRGSRSGGSGTGCNAAGPNVLATWNVNTVPATFTVNLVTATPLCFRGTAEIQVPSSNASLSYQLRDNTTNVGAAQTGNGGTLSFLTDPLTATNANYNVVATNGSSCTTAVSVGTISVDALPAAYANNGDVRTCYVNSNSYIEFRSPNGIMVAINSNGQNLGNVTVTEYAGAPVDVQACNTYQPWYVTATLGRHWAIEPQFQPSSPVSIRTYFDNSDYVALQAIANSNSNPNDDVAALGSLDLSKYSNPGNPSVINGTFTDNCNNGGTSSVYTPSATGNITSLSGYSGFLSTGRYTQYAFTGFSEFWLSGTDNVSPLPIELTSFNAACDNGNVKIDWVTATEINNEKFIVDRSANLQDWEEVVTVPGAGNSNQPLSYSTIDTRPLQGLSYYRLTQRDYDGASETFDPVSVVCYSDGNGNVMMVYPNPATDHYTVAVYVTEDIINANIELIDMNGKVVMVKNVNLVKGNNTFTYDATTTKPGAYVVQVRSSRLELKPVKLIIE